MRELCWLHLSDIHFRPSSEWSDATARQALLDHLEKQIQRHRLRIDLVLCTGDIAFGELSGGQALKTQYSLAQVFFDTLRRVCGDASKSLPADRIFIVPGNHDVNRSLVDPNAQATWTRFKHQADEHAGRINAEFSRLKDGDSVRFALNRLTDYGAFTQAAFPHQKPPIGHHHYAHVVDIDGCKVGIGGFNSAWTCAGPEDDRALWLAAEAQFNHMRAPLRDADLRIGLIHHPSDWFNRTEQRTIDARTKVDFDFWLHGHTHDLGVYPHAEGVRISAGATAADTANESGYAIVRLDTTSGAGSALLFHYDKHGRGHWKPFTVADVAEDGRHTFTLQRLAKPPLLKPDAPAFSAPTPPPRRLVGRPSPAPGPCLERTTELAQLAGWAQAEPPSPVLIHGYGGLGKTEIAVSYLCSKAARARFETRRYFISVEGLEAVAAAALPERFRQHIAYALLGEDLPLGESLADALYPLVSAAGTTLLVLDNFETVVKIDHDFACAALDELARLADAGLALAVTLRAPLANPRAHFEHLPAQPFNDPAQARRVLLYWMNESPDALLPPNDEAALTQLLALAEGWPIQLQMMGNLARNETLPALIARCPSSAAALALVDEVPGLDSHRHPLLSNRLTYDAPSITNAARSLLRALARFPDGVPSDWLNHWPVPEAVRCIRGHCLIPPSPGALGETRHKLVTPLRDFLLHAHPLRLTDRLALSDAATAWWRHHAPELFDTDLDRQSPTAYRDIHRQEIGMIAALRGNSVIRLSRCLARATVQLELRVGDVDDWRQQCRALRETILHHQNSFGSHQNAARFAWLLSGSEGLNVSVKQSVARLIADGALPPGVRDSLIRTFTQELNALTWFFGSQDLAERIWNRLANGEVCLQASLPVLLAEITALADSDEQIALLLLARSQASQYANLVRLREHLQQLCEDAPNSAVAAWASAQNSRGEQRLAHLRHAVECQPNYGAAWSDLAPALPDNAPERQTAWEATRRYARAHLDHATEQGTSVQEEVYRALFSAHIGLNDRSAAGKTLDDWTIALSLQGGNVITNEWLNLAKACLSVQRSDAAAQHLHAACTKATLAEADSIRRLTTQLATTAPAAAGRVSVSELYPRFHASLDLYRTAEILFNLAQPAAAQRLAERASHDPALPAALANDFAYKLLTRGDGLRSTLALGARLAQQAFAAQPTAIAAETLLCAALRQPAAVPDAARQTALAALMTITTEAPDKEVALIAGLLHDARRFDATAQLAAWLAECPAAEQSCPAGQWLAEQLANRPPASDNAHALWPKLKACLQNIGAAAQANTAWAASHRKEGVELAALVERLIDNSELDGPTRRG